ncbi:fimbrial protein [Siccibacter colletis]|uniref:fimbrial protein n=1 Tax=Siccibacter colletis TaxID=1505757 RepID=UPI0028BF13F8|nr:fimbrial protein [Siccibacter colletis]WNN47916.1 fimbrial protein [Siccibacter colletis]
MYSVTRYMQVLSLLLMGVTGFSGSANADSCADTSCKVSVLFKGTYLEDTCDVIINNGSSTETVVLPTLSTNTLKTNGAEAGSVAFDIMLKGCPTAKTISLWFAGTDADSATGNMVNAKGNEYSSNVQVRLRNAAGSQLVLNDRNSVQDYIIPAAGGDVVHSYQAMYYADGAGAVTPGLVNAMASINLTYR